MTQHIQLAEARFKSKEQFERRYTKRLRRKSYEGGEMVLVRNSEVEKELDRKSKPRYLGPYNRHPSHKRRILRTSRA